MRHEHSFISSDKDGYEVCADCGSYHSVKQDAPQQLYETEEYWTYEHNRSKFDEQIKNLNEEEGTGISKIDIVIKHIPDHAKDVLEGGCAPGELLRRLTEAGYNAIGIEPSGRYIEPILMQAPKSLVIKGYFPQCFTKDTENAFDCLIFMDVFEHVDDTDGFIEAAHRLLRKNGVLICMSPIIYEDGLYRERDFVSREHSWVYTKKFLQPYLENIFSKVEWDTWILGHEIFIATK